MISSLFLALAVVGGFSANEWTEVRKDLAPPVSYAIDGQRIAVNAANPYRAVRGRLIVAREGEEKEFAISNFPFTVSYADGLPSAGALRLGLEVSWFSAEGLVDRRVYFSRSEGGRLPRAARNLSVFDVEAHRRLLADRNAGIFLPYEQKADGLTTLVIEDAKGNRIRNLISAKEMKAGEKGLEWDGRDELGALVPPGEYTFRGLTHKGLRHEYLFQFYNGDEAGPKGWAANHSMMTALAANDEYLFAGARLTEGGSMLVALDAAGKSVKEFAQVHYKGSDFISIAADGKYLYVVMQGHSYSGQPDVRPRIAFFKYEIASTRLVPINGKESTFLYDSTIDLDEYRKHVTGHMWDQYPQERFMRGVAVLKDRLYIANAESGSVMAVDPKTAKVCGNFPLASPAAPFVVAGELWCASGRDVGVLRLDGAGTPARFEKKLTLPFAPTSISARNDELAVMGSPDDTVRFYDFKGRATGSLGEPGGAYAGRWQPKRLVAPMEVCHAPDGSLWTSEKRNNPKRLVRWNRKGEILYEKYGVAAYGSPTFVFDPADATRVYADDVEWKLDYAAKTATPVAVCASSRVLGQGLCGHVVRYRGGTYIVRTGRPLVIESRQDDGSLKPVAALWDRIANVRGRYGAPFPAFERALAETYARLPEARKVPWKDSTRGVFWLDRNSNGVPDAEEFEFLPEKNVLRGAAGFFGKGSMGMEFSFTVRQRGEPEKVVTFKPYGLLPNGVPHYDAKRAFAEAKPVAGNVPNGDRGQSGVESYTDLRGNVLSLSWPFMCCTARDGRLRWIYANRYSSVHASHHAPLYRKGELVGTLFSMGTAPLDAEGDVTALMMNTGLVTLFTTDGLFIDDLFHDGRMYPLADFDNLGGEPFGGTFQRDAATGRYLLQGGHGGFRIYQVKGLETVRRFAGSFRVTSEQLEAAQRRHPQKGDAARQEATAIIPRLGAAGASAAKPIVAWRHGTLSNSVFAGYDDTRLYLKWTVEGDMSPWTNAGKDWKLLFKTGDSVDFQFSTTPMAKEGKRNRVRTGDFRLLLAPFGKETCAVLYRYQVDRSDGKAKWQPADFSSPWRTFRVDDVRRIALEKCRVTTRADGYTVEAEIPLAALGLKATDMRGRHQGDFGVIYGDQAGKVNLIRSYWSNKATGLVNDVPGEIMPTVDQWGILKLEETK